MSRLEWEHEKGVVCVICPDCAFTFDAGHEDQDGGYSCPQCQFLACQERAEQMEKALEEANRHLGQRLVQLGFTEECAAHGLKYSDYCGGCGCAKLAPLSPVGLPRSSGEQTQD